MRRISCGRPARTAARPAAGVPRAGMWTSSIPGCFQRRRERALGVARLAGVGDRPHVGHPPDAGLPQQVQEIRRRQALVADGGDARRGHAGKLAQAGARRRPNVCDAGGFPP